MKLNFSRFCLPVFVILCLAISCTKPKEETAAESKDSSGSSRIPVIFDTDANNELDDQHALAYLFYNQQLFDVKGVTVNTTMGGGNIDSQYAEAERIMKLCAIDTIPLIKGADKSFREISPTISSPDYDGHEAVDFIIKTTHENTTGKLVLIAVGKLTTVALALQKDPSIAEKIRLVWLGSNYPDPGEYNLESDSVPMNYIFKNNIEFEMVTVRYGKPSGTGAVKLSHKDAREKMAGLGPEISTPVVGRHGGEFSKLGDYLVNLFDNIKFDQGSSNERALFDVAAIAVVKNPSWGEVKEIPAPIMIDGKFVDHPGNSRKVKVWENFDRDAIINDFLTSIGYRK